MPQCRKCNTTFPNRKVIDGKKRSLNSRKFCLNCSPFGSRNTKPDDPTKTSYRKVENGKRAAYKEWSQEAQEDFKARLYWRAKNRKDKLVELSGGKCKECGYYKCSRAMTFHHRDPSQKRFPLDKRTLQSKNWDDILEEVKKCDLLCIRCHMETEDKISESQYLTYQKKFSHLV